MLVKAVCFCAALQIVSFLQLFEATVLITVFFFLMLKLAVLHLFGTTAMADDGAGQPALQADSQ